MGLGRLSKDAKLDHEGGVLCILSGSRSEMQNERHYRVIMGVLMKRGNSSRGFNVGEESNCREQRGQ